MPLGCKYDEQMSLHLCPKCIKPCFVLPIFGASEAGNVESTWRLRPPIHEANKRPPMLTLKAVSRKKRSLRRCAAGPRNSEALRCATTGEEARAKALWRSRDCFIKSLRVPLNPHCLEVASTYGWYVLRGTWHYLSGFRGGKCPKYMAVTASATL